MAVAAGFAIAATAGAAFIGEGVGAGCAGAGSMGVQPNDVIDIKNPATLRAVMLGIIVHENSGSPYPDAVFEEGLRRALL